MYKHVVYNLRKIAKELKLTTEIIKTDWFLDKENFEVEFPFTVPHEYKGSVDIELVAKVREQKDSIRYTVITNTNK